jgi:hypothetical protein
MKTIDIQIVRITVNIVGSLLPKLTIVKVRDTNAQRGIQVNEMIRSQGKLPLACLSSSARSLSVGGPDHFQSISRSFRLGSLAGNRMCSHRRKERAGILGCTTTALPARGVPRNLAEYS